LVSAETLAAEPCSRPKPALLVILSLKVAWVDSHAALNSELGSPVGSAPAGNSSRTEYES
jgi:hypothetical protein